MNIRKSILVIICAMGVFLAPGIAFATIDLISFHVNPETPGPNQEVTISLQSYAVDLDSANFIWSVDKKVVASGIGQKSITTTTKDFGQASAIEVVITTPLGAHYDKQLSLKPIEVDLLWEADTFVPPFYKGKALPTYKSIVKLSAISRFNSPTSDPGAYSYTWTANQTQGLGTGLGTNSVRVQMKYTGSVVPVAVEVNNLGPEGGSGKATQNITAVDPLLLFYEDAPLLGIRFDHALIGSVPADGASFTLHAVPYFFSNDDIANTNLIYKWYKDNVLLDLGVDPNAILIGKTGTAAQRSALRLSLQNNKRVLQSANAAVTINFSAEH